MVRIGRKSKPKKPAAEVKELAKDPTFSKLQDKTPVLDQEGGGLPGPRLLEPCTFDEAAYHIPVPLVTASALRAYIERSARPLEKVIRIANGQDVNGHAPTWDDQKDAIYCLVNKVAPNLSAVEINDVSDPKENSQAHIANKLVDALTQLAFAKRAGESVPLTIEDDGSPSTVGRQGKA